MSAKNLSDQGLAMKIGALALRLKHDISFGPGDRAAAVEMLDEAAARLDKPVNVGGTVLLLPSVPQSTPGLLPNLPVKQGKP